MRIKRKREKKLPSSEQQTGTTSEQSDNELPPPKPPSNRSEGVYVALGRIPKKNQVELPSRSNREEAQWKEAVRKPKPNSQPKI